MLGEVKLKALQDLVGNSTPDEIIWMNGYLSAVAQHNSRTPAGHPEGYLEAFANHYRNFALCIKAQMSGEKPKEEWLDFPGVEEGIRGMAFIENVVKSGNSDNKWTLFEI